MLSLCFLLAFSPLSAQSSPSPDGMTDAEIIAELMSNLEKREALIVEKEKSIETRQDRLTKREDALTQRETNLKERESILMQRSMLQAETETYWKNYKNDSARSRIVAFAGGVAVGFVLGGYSGFRLGVTIQY